MTIAVTELYNSCMYTLLETADSAAAEPISGLYTRDAFIAAVNLKTDEYMKRTGIFVKNNQTQAAVVGARDIAIPTDVLDLLEVSYSSPTYGYTIIPEGSTVEADLFISDNLSPTDTPEVYSIENSVLQAISLIPPPSATNLVRFCYTAKVPQLASPPSGNLELPDDIVPFIKFGALAELFEQSGEAHDPERAMLCASLFDLGIEVGRSWISGQT